MAKSNEEIYENIYETDVEYLLKWYSGNNGVVRLKWYDVYDITVDGDISKFSDGEIAVVFFNRGEYYIVLAGTGITGLDFIIAKGDGDHIRKYLLKKIRKYNKEYKKNRDGFSKMALSFYLDVLSLFEAVDKALNEM